MTREYKSSLREEQMEQTREKILDAVQKVILEDGAAELSVAFVAERAGVSVRTAYRYFPTKEALIDAYNEQARRLLGDLKFPSSIAELKGCAEELFQKYAPHAEWIRAARSSRAANEVRERRKRDQVKQFARLLAPATAGLDPVEARGLAGALHTLLSSDTYLNMRDFWGLDGDEAGRAIDHVVQLVIEDARKRGAQRGTTNDNDDGRSQ